MGSDNNFIKGQLDQAVKEYYVYDNSNRLIEHYTALSDAENGDFAIKTEYEYSGSSTRVIKTKESKVTWDSSWDI